MRKLVIFLSLVFITLTSCKTDVKKEVIKSGFSVNGTLSTTNSSLVYLLNDLNVKIDSSKINKNSFTFNGFVDSAKDYKIQVQNQTKKHPIIIENSKYSVFVDKNDITIIGGLLNTKQQKFNSLKKELSFKKLALLDSFMVKKITSKDFRKSIEEINSELKILNSDYIIANANNLLSSTLFLTPQNFNLEELKSIVSNTEVAKSTILKTLLDKEITRQQQIFDAELAEKNKIVAAKKVYRKPAIMFSGDGLNRELISLESIIKGNKIVLIDFWASWCGPCRMVTPRVREIYNKYKNKGFTILTVSEDKNRETWKSGIEQDNMLSWHHIFDDYGRISSMYGIKSIPYMVLIDGNGGIIKEKISVSELEYQLQKLL
ncbi:AhpC/TSA family protein [Polaribacter sp. Z014]|uniref:TlpA disulfide reductase family protein n=1 Tax=Polaribacter sp. Z014 TaxID=2927126 RepID=UPI0020204FFE|nr:TlpA disulfide reductase family protein [Polaribacter sp. Z014]MCL7764595.1 AhpC/TSA family protein [Polaribacter sp. Z014]